MSTYYAFRDVITTIQSPLLDKESPFYNENESMNVILRTAKSDPRFPRAKYINIVKLNQSKRRYISMGVTHIPKIYSIGILTTDNHYYYSEIKTNSTALSKSLIDKLNLIFNAYVMERDTKITISDNISDYNEPIRLYLTIVANCVCAQIRQAPYISQIRRINKTFQYIHPQGKKRKVKTTRLSMKQHEMLLKKLIKNNRFDFLVGDNDFIHKRESYSKNDFKKHLVTAMGILYMYTKERNYEYDMNCRRHRELRKKLEKEREEIQNGCQ